MIGGSIAGALLGAGALSGGLSWLFVSRKREEERKKKLRAIRERKARLAALRSSISESADTSMEGTSRIGNRNASGAVKAGSRDAAGSSSMVTIDTSGSSVQVMDSSALSLPVIDVHAGSKNMRKSANGGNGPSLRGSGGYNKDSKPKVSLSTELSNFE